MKKYHVSAALLLLSGLPMFSQNPVVDNPNNKGYFGIRLGGEITCPGKLSVENFSVSAFKNGGGVEFGGIYNFPVVANFYIEPGLKFYYNTYSFKDFSIMDIEEDIVIQSASMRKFGMRIPVMAGYHFDFTDDVKLSLFTGPELEIGLSAKGHVKGSFQGMVIDESESAYGDNEGMNRVDLLWGAGAGITYQNLYFGVSGGIGMLNMLSDSDVKFHENRVTFSIGYNF